MLQTINHKTTLLLASVVLVVLVGCGGGVDSNFPTPSDVSNFTGQGGDTQINFQTDMSISDIEMFYRDALSAQGLIERTITTVSTDITLNLVMDGYTDDQAVVVQATVLPTGGTNVNVRAEKI